MSMMTDLSGDGWDDGSDGGEGSGWCVRVSAIEERNKKRARDR